MWNWPCSKYDSKSHETTSKPLPQSCLTGKPTNSLSYHSYHIHRVYRKNPQLRGTKLTHFYHHEISGKVSTHIPDPLAPRSTKRGSILAAMARTCLVWRMTRKGGVITHFGQGISVFKAKLARKAVILLKGADSSLTNASSVVLPSQSSSFNSAMTRWTSPWKLGWDMAS